MVSLCICQFPQGSKSQTLYSGLPGRLTPSIFLKCTCCQFLMPLGLDILSTFLASVLCLRLVCCHLSALTAHQLGQCSSTCGQGQGGTCSCWGRMLNPRIPCTPHANRPHHPGQQAGLWEKIVGASANNNHFSNS